MKRYAKRMEMPVFHCHSHATSCLSVKVACGLEWGGHRVDTDQIDGEIIDDHISPALHVILALSTSNVENS